MSRIDIRILLIVGSIFLANNAVSAEGSGDGGRFDFSQKTKDKENSRWTLQDWLAQKQRNHLMDHWLEMYAPTPYEFFLEGNVSNYKMSSIPNSSVDESHQSTAGSVGAFATVVGLEGSYEHNIEENYTDLAGALNLRILGNAVQGTHLQLFYGLRTRTINTAGVDNRIGNPMAGADLNLYVTRFAGISGRYSHYLEIENETLGKVSGYKSEAGLFIDFKNFRIQGSWYYDRQEMEKAQVKSAVDRSGVKTGFKFFF
jgi:hypothetical protein